MGPFRAVLFNNEELKVFKCNDPKIEPEPSLGFLVFKGELISISSNQEDYKDVCVSVYEGESDYLLFTTGSTYGRQ